MQDSSAVRIEKLREKLQKDPGSALFVQLTEEFRRAGKMQEAVDTCLRGLEKNPCYHSARASLGRLYLEMERFEEAQLELERVLAVSPDNLLARKLLEELQSRIGKQPVGPAPPPAGPSGRSRQPAPPVPRVDPPPRPKPATETLAAVYLQQGHPEEAIRVYRRILEREPGNQAALRKLADLERKYPDRPAVASAAAPRPAYSSAAPAGEPVPNRKRIDALQSWLRRIRRES